MATYQSPRTAFDNLAQYSNTNRTSDTVNTAVRILWLPTFYTESHLATPWYSLFIWLLTLSRLGDPAPVLSARAGSQTIQ